MSFLGGLVRTRIAPRPYRPNESCWHGIACCGWGDCAAQGSQLRAMHPQAIADVVQSDGVRELGVEQGDHMTPRGEGARVFVQAVLAGQFRDHVAGNVCANLIQCAKLRPG